eukprot:GHVU01036387.1.p3 GENE.GHVU01036387.1~~GHVU01036387.1.p3  ORF type:complete len:134 (-),score=16.06 GHVU01036387.1:466-867(-)
MHAQHSLTHTSYADTHPSTHQPPGSWDTTLKKEKEELPTQPPPLPPPPLPPPNKDHFIFLFALLYLLCPHIVSHACFTHCVLFGFQTVAAPASTGRESPREPPPLEPPPREAPRPRGAPPPPPPPASLPSADT